MTKKQDNRIHPEHDVMGQAGLDYLINKEGDTPIKVKSDIAETDFLPVRYLFREFHEMPELEQKALMLSYGRVLDVGAGMGSHSLYLQGKGMDITALELSPMSCEVMTRRGVDNVVCDDFFHLKATEKFDTLLLLMNGIGITGSVNRLPAFFKKSASLLNPGGQILLDSSDLRYLFLDDDGSILINLNDKYYGEVVYRMDYKEFSGKRFPWLFIDDELLNYYAQESGFLFEKISDGPHFDYLARLIIQE